VQLEVVTAEPRLVTFTPNQPVDPQPTTGQQVAQGRTVTKPADPACPGYRFVGWYTSPRIGGERFDFGKPVMENTPLYGR
ncbi:InlB B-repeat-containing protein, partial [Bifidobacterium coryneforme]